MLYCFHSTFISITASTSDSSIHCINNKENFNLTSVGYWLSAKMSRATNPSTLKREIKSKFAENEVSSDSESTSEY